MTAAPTVDPTATADADGRRASLGWLARRIGLGATPDELDRLVEADDPIADLVASGGDDPTETDPWEGRSIEPGVDGRRDVVAGWVGALLSTPAPLVDRRSLLLHGWLVTSIADVPGPAMAEQVRLFRGRGGGSFPDLLRAITTDPAMLIYLDGRTSVAGAPNENYARELLELFSLGTGEPDAPAPYGEDDVRAVAVALTGWTVRRPGTTSTFVAGRHDDTPQTVLGRTGVRDVDGVVDAIVAHPEHDRFVADRIARTIVGVDDPTTVDGGRPDPDVVEALAEAYRRADRHLDPLLEAAARVVFDGAPTDRRRPIVTDPLVWLAGAVRMLGLDDRIGPRLNAEQVRSMGHVPGLPPSVAGWPGGTRWLTTSALVARTNVAAGVASAALADADRNGPSAVVEASDDGDLDRLAIALGLLEPFSNSTAAAIRGADGPAAALTLALVSPEYLLT